MKNQSDLFLLRSNADIEEVGEGVTRQLLGFDDSILMARAVFREGAVGYVHSHPHSQVTYVESGVFEFTIGSETRQLKTGDGTYIPPGVDHGAICIEAGALLDVFSPIREDFLDERKA